MSDKGKNIKGLTNREVAERVRMGMTNVESAATTKSISAIITGNLVTLFNVVNCIMAFCIIMVHSYKNMMFMGVVFWNTFIGIFQEIRSKKIIDKMSIMSQSGAFVVRDGTEVKIKRSDIVIDDLLVVRTGNQVCSDCVIEDGTCLVDESMLTGESDAVVKKEGDQLFAGSFVVNGVVRARVNRVGADNYSGKITRKVKYIKKNSSEMMKSIKTIIKFISICIIPLAAILFVNQMNLASNGIKGAVINTVAAIVGTMPSGLVLLTTMVMEVGVIRLSKHNTLVQDMYCMETLARVDVICLDKTGTITEGKMQVEKVVCVGDTKEDEVHMMMANYAHAMDEKNATFDAVKEYFGERHDWKVKDCLPFSSERKYSAASFENVGTCVMGAIEYLDGIDENEYKNIYGKYMEEGYRVVAICFSDSAVDDVEESMKNLEVKGFLMIKDRIRKSAAKTLEYFKEQKVDIKVISGDNPVTVKNIAKDAGIDNYNMYLDCSEVKEDKLRKNVEDYTIFGRTTPEQKLAIVEELQKKGHVVAMTGDGVNDVMALKAADCSIAMQAGSDAARNVSQMILMDSDFASLPKVLGEGRRAINNMQRSAVLYLVKTIYSFIMAIVFSILNIKYPFSPIQLTLIGALSIGIPSFVLAMEPNFQRVKGKFLPNVMEKAVPGALLILFNVFAAVIASWNLHVTYVEQSTIAIFSTAVASTIVLLKLCRPFTVLRGVMLAFITGVFLLAFGFFKSLFCVTHLGWQLMAVLGVIFLADFFVHYLLIQLVDKILLFMYKKGVV